MTMGIQAARLDAAQIHPVQLHLAPALEGRNRLTTAFRLILAIPHLLLVGAPIAAGLTWRSGAESGISYGWEGSGGVLGAAAAVVAMIAWFAILFTGRFPLALYEFGEGALRWTIRVEAYLLLLRDEYPPFTVAA
jgi:hypothetical protein